MTTKVNYFISGLTPGDLSKLAEAGIKFSPFEIGGVTGILIEEAFAPVLKKALETEFERTTETSFEGIRCAVLKTKDGRVPEIPPESKPKPPPSVIRKTWDGLGYEYFAKITEEVLLPVIKKDINIYVPHGCNAQPLDNGCFNIFIWSSRLGARATVPPQMLWRVPVSLRDTAFRSSGTGSLTIYHGLYEVAEVVGDNLYIHHDAVHEASSDERKIFRKILELVVLFLKSPEEYAALIAENDRERRSESRELYQKACSGRIESEKLQLRDVISRSPQQVRKLQTDLATLIRTATDDEMKLSIMEKGMPALLEGFGAEFDRLLQVKSVRDAWIDGNRLFVRTDILYCTDPRSKKVHEIGAFEILISLSAGACDEKYLVKWNNLTRKVDTSTADGMNAPHVFSEGVACLGSIQKVIPELIGRYEFAAVVMIAIQFIESVNVEDAAGRYINKWPLAEASVPKPEPTGSESPLSSKLAAAECIGLP